MANGVEDAMLMFDKTTNRHRVVQFTVEDIEASEASHEDIIKVSTALTDSLSERKLSGREEEETADAQRDKLKNS
ncbi:hypothetical protein ROHU_021147 [Labeo rohita]|uniref:Uncharacterized protein n=1 Tax=Labeo rohita TaxID=84645 RepID=A0A498N283_LABRO|nr:hypothetical protein ROHU_021147 [Labeo rohita]